MSEFQIHASNNFHALADSLSDLLKKIGLDPFVCQPVVVQSLGVQRWLTWHLARKHGICAGIEFLNPRKFIDQCTGTQTTLWAPDALAWRLMACLKNASESEVTRYLGEVDVEQSKAFGLATRLANLLDQYMVYRPNLIRQWRQGESLDWQGRLWRDLCKSIPEDDPALRREQFLQSPPVDRRQSPICFFALGLLPPEYLRVIHAAAQSREVHLFILQPTDLEWTDLLTIREEARLESAGEVTGHPLLVSMGRQGREFQKVLLEVSSGYDHESFEPPTGQSLLARLQSDIFKVDHPLDPTRAVDNNDVSIQVHACHSSLREVEVLHDELLRLFDQMPELQPHEVVVMTPDIEGYAPFLRAVFENPDTDTAKIPFTIADRHPRRSSGFIDAFLSLLEMRDHTLPVTDVLTRLETGAVRRRFGLDAADLERLHQRCLAARIHWGYDGAHRESLGLPNEPQNTWRFGLDRMLLGYAMQSEGDAVCEGILPLPGVEGDTAVAVGALDEFTGALRQLSAGLQATRNLGQWADWLEVNVLEQFFQADPTESNDEQQVRKAIQQLRALAAHCADPVPLAPVREQLLTTLEKAVTHDGYLRGSVTCCALKPLRSIPFRVICLLGMNDGAFPRADPRDAFNHLLNSRQTGDRSVRDDDRYLFLETILAAREVLYLSYQGRSLQDDTEFPPSVLVGELLDALDATFKFPIGNARKQLGRVHRLQAFSPAYFDSSRPELVSYSAANAQAAGVFHARAHSPVVFLPEPLPAPPDEQRIITVDDLLLFYKNPARWFAQKRLGTYTGHDRQLLDDTERFVIDGLDKYSLDDRLLNLATGQPPEADWGEEMLREVLLAEGTLPHGPAGAASLRERQVEIGRFTRQLEEAGLILQPGKAIDVDMELGDFKIRGQLTRFAAETQLCLRPATVKGGDFLQAWLRHLLWHAQPGANAAGTAVVGSDKGKLEQYTLTAPNDAAAHLSDLLELFWLGQSAPLRLFPQSSHAFAKKIQSDPGAIAPAMKVAKEKWEGSEFSFPEKDDDYYDLCFRHTDPLEGDEFSDTARRVFGPFLELAAMPDKK